MKIFMDLKLNEENQIQFHCAWIDIVMGCLQSVGIIPTEPDVDDDDFTDDKIDDWRNTHQIPVENWILYASYEAGNVGFVEAVKQNLIAEYGLTAELVDGWNLERYHQGE